MKRTRKTEKSADCRADIPNRERVASRDPEIENAETLVFCALKAFAYDTERLRETLLRIGESVASLPEETLRPALRTVSARLDAEFLFVNPWGEANWSLFIRSVSETIKPDFHFDDIDEDEDTEDDCFARRPFVPWLAFLLAGTDFLFTEDELFCIRDAEDKTVGQVREEAIAWRSPERRSDSRGEVFSG